MEWKILRFGGGKRGWNSKVENLKKKHSVENNLFKVPRLLSEWNRDAEMKKKNTEKICWWRKRERIVNCEQLQADLEKKRKICKISKENKFPLERLYL